WGIVKRALTAADNVIGPRETNQAAIIPEDVSKFLFETRGSFFGKLEAARDAVLTGICLGLRPGELLGIRARDIHCAFGSMDLLVTVNLVSRFELGKGYAKPSTEDGLLALGAYSL
ncbi:hypothetical protein FOZ62_013445, partial [Perkinsus olseni]